MSVLDIEDKYPDEDFWLEIGFIAVKKLGLWVAVFSKHLHWDLPSAGTRWGNIKIYTEYDKYSKVLIITQHQASIYYDEVDFEPIKLHKPTQQEIEMVLSVEYLSNRLTYKYK